MIHVLRALRVDLVHKLDARFVFRAPLGFLRLPLARVFLVDQLLFQLVVDVIFVVAVFEIQEELPRLLLLTVSLRCLHARDGFLPLENLLDHFLVGETFLGPHLVLELLLLLVVLRDFVVHFHLHLVLLLHDLLVAFFLAAPLFALA